MKVIIRSNECNGAIVFIYIGQMPFLKYKKRKHHRSFLFPAYQHYNFYQPHTLNKSVLSLFKRDTKSEDQVKLRRDEVSIKTGLFVILFTFDVLNDKHFNVFKKRACYT